MTQLPNPPNSGQPNPVAGVTGGPSVFGGQISNDPNDGSVVITPNPGNTLQLRKGAQPQGLQIYERFDNNTNYTRLGLYAQTNGPFRITTESQGGAPNGARELDINAGTTLKLQTAIADRIVIQFNGTTRVIGTTNDGTAYALAVSNLAQTNNIILARNDGLASIGNGAFQVDPAFSGAPAIPGLAYVAANNQAGVAGGTKAGLQIAAMTGANTSNVGLLVGAPTGGTTNAAIVATCGDSQTGIIFNGTPANGYGIGIRTGELSLYTGASQLIGFRDGSLGGTLGVTLTPGTGILAVGGTSGHIRVTTSVATTSVGGQLCIGSLVTGTASAGANGAPPAAVAGYLVWNNSGVVIKVPYYNN